MPASNGILSKNRNRLPAGGAVFIGVGGEDSDGQEAVHTACHHLPQKRNIA